LRADLGETNGNRFVLVHHRAPLSEMDLGLWGLFAVVVCGRQGEARVDDTLHVFAHEDGASIELAVIGADGSADACCGNGLLYSGHRHLREYGRRAVDVAMAGTRERVERTWNGARATMPAVHPLDLPPIAVAALAQEPVTVEALEPHAVSFADSVSQLRETAFEQVGAQVCSTQPHGINWDLVSLAEDHLEIRTFERGARRLTKSCGTGSVAALYAARESGRWLQDEAVVRSQGGEHFVSVKGWCSSLAARPVHLGELIVRDLLRTLT
jgi:diaminopimelate epimerase